MARHALRKGQSAASAAAAAAAAASASAAGCVAFFRVRRASLLIWTALEVGGPAGRLAAGRSPSARVRSLLCIGVAVAGLARVCLTATDRGGASLSGGVGSVDTEGEGPTAAAHSLQHPRSDESGDRGGGAAGHQGPPSGYRRTGRARHTEAAIGGPQAGWKLK
ncbi:uncharacterized protein LOC126417122 [Schistocerca serialis cubense]|uniref:uncharacterized protein LOC126417122 n=1 Tax=Schistocerca serialis cubense TaxID=2023355 RepID=UPI00214E3E17|nr:uncharacterized protein LOC126417122 [Schistocerca serialis cubense]